MLAWQLCFELQLASSEDFCQTRTLGSEESFIINTPTRHQPVKFCTCEGSVNDQVRMKFRSGADLGIPSMCERMSNA